MKTSFSAWIQLHTNIALYGKCWERQEAPSTRQQLTQKGKLAANAGKLHIFFMQEIIGTAYITLFDAFANYNNVNIISTFFLNKISKNLKLAQPS